jgi:hypothetical protein
MRKDKVCDVCWTSSWQPCEENTPNAVKDGNGWMVCGYCKLEEAYRKLLKYTARANAYMKHGGLPPDEFDDLDKMLKEIK